MIGALADRADLLLAVALFLIGLYAVIAKENLIKKFIGLNIMETGVFVFIIAGGTVDGGRAPVVSGTSAGPYNDPVSQTLVLVGIVVAVSITALALAMIVRIYREHGTIEADELRGRDR